MAIPLPLEIVAGVSAASLTIGLLRGSVDDAALAQQPNESTTWAPLSALPANLVQSLRQGLRTYLLGQGRLQSVGLLLLRLAVGVMMIHHGQDKLADPQGFATNYVAALHLPFPLLMAYAAGYAEIIGSWLLIFGLFTPFGALALSGTMAVAGYHHILTSGLNIYVLELVVLYLGGSLGLLLLGPGRFSFDAGIARELLQDDDGNEREANQVATAAGAGSSAVLKPIPVAVNGR
jgi:putative oxidoreductase